jgi:catechol 2,3-dioxygenase-like lactoylglutathione lyase family enzyme
VSTHVRPLVSRLHVVYLYVRDMERSLAFYTGELGLPGVRVEEWRRGEVPFASLRVDEATIIDVLSGERFGCNVDHAAFVVDADAAALAALAEEHGVDGPRELFGARGQGRGIYLRDPDGNGVELRTYR